MKQHHVRREVEWSDTVMHRYERANVTIGSTVLTLRKHPRAFCELRYPYLC